MARSSLGLCLGKARKSLTKHGLYPVPERPGQPACLGVRKHHLQCICEPLPLNGHLTSRRALRHPGTHHRHIGRSRKTHRFQRVQPRSRHPRQSYSSALFLSFTRQFNNVRSWPAAAKPVALRRKRIPRPTLVFRSKLQPTKSHILSGGPRSTSPAQVHRLSNDWDKVRDRFPKFCRAG
jgi:hypothetical protein